MSKKRTRSTTPGSKLTTKNTRISSVLQILKRLVPVLATLLAIARELHHH